MLAPVYDPVAQARAYADEVMRTAGAQLDLTGRALLAEDAAAVPVPYTLSGGTDAKALSRLGITCYGFAPLRLPPDLDFSALFHGIDERVPIDSLEFGVRVLDRFLRSA